MKKNNTIEKEEISELIEKKSKFIASVYHIESIKEAEEKLMQVKKRYHDARHNCYAYRVIEEKNIIERSSDDGEPSGTAGAPILNILKQENLCNVLVVVTRYFGGILLGTGGLVRAYSQSTKEVIEKSNIVLKQEGYVVEIEVEYKDFEKLKYFCKIKDIKIINVQYLENIIVQMEIKSNQKFLFDTFENINFNPIKCKIIQEKYIEIYIKIEIHKTL